MQKQLLFFLLLTLTKLTFSQEKSFIIKGRVYVENTAVSDVHIVNKNTNIGTNSSDTGFFEIPVKEGDILYLSHVNLEEKELIVFKSIHSTDEFKIYLNEKTYQLNEITIGQPKSIFYIDPEIILNNAPIVTAKTLNLPYAGTKVKKNEAILSFRSGTIISLDNLINSLNGKKKQKEMAEKVSKEDANLLKIRKLYTDDFFVTDLKVKKEYINQFLDYCSDNHIINYFKKGNTLKLTEILIKESKNFPHQIENELLYLTRN